MLEEMVAPERVRLLNDFPAREGAAYVLYWAMINRRLDSNHGLAFAVETANRLNLPVLVYEALTFAHKYANPRFQSFILDGELIALTPHTITSPAALRAELKMVRQLGYALDDRENQADMRCIAVPVLDREGRAVAALSAADGAERMTEAFQQKVRDALFDTASALRQKLYPVIAPIPSRRPIAAE